MKENFINFIFIKDSYNYVRLHINAPMITIPIYRVFALVLFALLSVDTNATEQTPDILIADQDTFYLYYTFPIDDLGFEKCTNPFKLYNNVEFIATNCWRGYQAIWEIKDGRLYLENVKICNQDSLIDYSIVIKYFIESGREPKIEHGKILADWYSTHLVVFKDILHEEKRNLIGVEKIKKKHKKVFTIVQGKVVK